MSLDAMKFLQAFIKEMINVGGENLPKTISSTLGAKLGKIYKSKGIKGFVDGLKQCYKVLGSKANIVKISDNKYEVSLKYSRKFCPVGGTYAPDMAELVQDSICRPYTISLLNQLDNRFRYRADLHECILKAKTTFCRYTLYIEEKEK